ncbi:uncharacterized protein LOC116958213 isoform X1 [Petromyzon marinus]|uniref:uncharacterized protein LOC116958213 isoform X1 n=1 Tax=Petromyzon marinus TaxID=7757 RepID=UPI003F712B17
MFLQQGQPLSHRPFPTQRPQCPWLTGAAHYPGSLPHGDGMLGAPLGLGGLHQSGPHGQLGFQGGPALRFTHGAGPAFGAGPEATHGAGLVPDPGAESGYESGMGAGLAHGLGACLGAGQGMGACLGTGPALGTGLGPGGMSMGSGLGAPGMGPGSGLRPVGLGHGLGAGPAFGQSHCPTHGESTAAPGPTRRRAPGNRKERRRTQSINLAFSELRERIPSVPADTKLSKIKTLRLAARYISHLMGVLARDPSETPEHGHPAGACTAVRFPHTRTHTPVRCTGFSANVRGSQRQRHVDTANDSTLMLEGHGAHGTFSILTVPC